VFGQTTSPTRIGGSGFGAIWLLVGHAIFLRSATGWASVPRGRGVRDAAHDVSYVLLVRRGPRHFMAVGITSVEPRGAVPRTRPWYTIHLYTYLAIALAFLHSSLSAWTSPRTVSRACTGSRVRGGIRHAGGLPVRPADRHLVETQFHVANVVERPGVASLYLTGRDCTSSRSEPGSGSGFAS